MPGLFGYRPLHLADGRPHLLDHGFVAFDEDRGVAHPFAVTDYLCAYTRLVFSSAAPAGVREDIARHFWRLLVDRGTPTDFRADGLEWSTAFDPGGLDVEDVLWEVGLWGEVYYAESVAHDHHFDPDFSRPDRSWHRYRQPPSRRRRAVRRVG